MTKRFKGLNLIYRVPEELWIEVHDIVQRTVIKTIPKKKKCKKAKWLSEEALQIAEKRREAKAKKERSLPSVQCSSYIMGNARLDEVQAAIKITGKNINNLRYADDTTLMAESEEIGRASCRERV